MLSYPTATTRDEKMAIINKISDRLLKKYPEKVLAIGVYGSIGQGTDGPFSDIEMHVITRDGADLERHEFVYEPFKIEIDTEQKSNFFQEAAEVDDSWPIKAGMFIHIVPIFDPEQIFEKVKKLPFQVSDKAFRDTMREFMIWEPYETMGKIRNNYRRNNLNYLPIGAKDLVWQTAKLIGLANKTYYSTRARTLEESLSMKSKPSGYEELVKKVMEGQLDDKELVYQLCEHLWEGLNIWFDELGIEYKSKELPF